MNVRTELGEKLYQDNKLEMRWIDMNCKRHNYSDPDSKRFDPDLDYYVRVCVNCGEMEE